VERRAQGFLFDLDGTLVDSVYQHVLAWQDALDATGIELSVWRIHRKVGMSGGLFANALLRETGREVSAELAGELRRRHAEAYAARAARVRPLPGARELLAHLTSVGAPWAIATSGYRESAGPTIELLSVAPASPSSPATSSNAPSPTPTCSWPPPRSSAWTSGTAR
jgi:phosphoglycolate phosphatase-like HAD superfamily hydrolase